MSGCEQETVGADTFTPATRPVQATRAQDDRGTRPHSLMPLDPVKQLHGDERRPWIRRCSRR